MTQLTLHLTDGRESQTDRLRRILAGTGGKVKRASDLSFTPRRAIAASAIAHRDNVREAGR